MTDLLSTLPDFPLTPYTHLIPSLEKNGTTVADLLTLDAVEIVKRCPLPLLDVRRLVKSIVEALQVDLGVGNASGTASDEQLPKGSTTLPVEAGPGFKNALDRRETISTLDPTLDDALGGGIPMGYVTEITGESGAGKTQFLLSLLLSGQLQPAESLARSTIYISTEAQLSTRRLQQMLKSHHRLCSLPPSQRPSLDRVRAMPVQDLEVQEHILEYQLPTAVRRYNVGLVVLDSIAANFRAEHGSSLPKDLAERAAQLAKIGGLLRYLAASENIAVVVANQVSDRFDSTSDRAPLEILRSSSPAMPSSPAPPRTPSYDPSGEDPARAAVMALDHQQRFFTGWGDESTSRVDNPKTPALGLAWTTQVAARIALRMEGVGTDTQLRNTAPSGDGANIWKDRKKRRFFKLVFAPWAEGGPEIEYEIGQQGPGALSNNKNDA